MSKQQEISLLRIELDKKINDVCILIFLPIIPFFTQAGKRG